jgi:hypothetical protein
VTQQYLQAAFVALACTATLVTVRRVQVIDPHTARWSAMLKYGLAGVFSAWALGQGMLDAYSWWMALPLVQIVASVQLSWREWQDGPPASNLIATRREFGWAMRGGICAVTAVALMSAFTSLPDLLRAGAVQLTTGPIAKMRGTLVAREPGAVVLRIGGEKLAQETDCTWRDMRAYTLTASGERREAYVVALDLPDQGTTKLPGHYDLGRYRIWPADADAARVLVYARHYCSSVPISTLIAEVKLK